MDLHGGDTIALATRLGRLPPAAKRVLQIAAVVGLEVTVALLHALTGISEDSLGALLNHLQHLDDADGE